MCPKTKIWDKSTSCCEQRAVVDDRTVSDAIMFEAKGGLFSHRSAGGCVVCAPQQRSPPGLRGRVSVGGLCGCVEVTASGSFVAAGCLFWHSEIWASNICLIKSCQPGVRTSLPVCATEAEEDLWVSAWSLTKPPPLHQNPSWTWLAR